jgi:hypothetical protein
VAGGGPAADFDWSSLDGPGVLWLRRAAPESTPLHAGFVATGGEPVPGPLGPRGAGHPTGGDPRAQLHFDGRDLVPADPAGDAVLLSGPCPAELERALAAWTASRGLELVRAPQSPSGPLWLRVEVRPAGAELAAEEWLELRPDRALPMQVEPGQLTVLGGPWPEPADGPAFALAAARLFDRAALAPVERAALTARLSAGPPSVVPGSEPPRRGSEPLSSGWPLAALGALAFAVAARLHSS